MRGMEAKQRQGQNTGKEDRETKKKKKGHRGPTTATLFIDLLIRYSSIYLYID